MKPLEKSDKMINKDEIYYNPNDIVIAKYRMYLSSGFDLFVMHNFLYKHNDSYELGKCFNDINTFNLSGLLNCDSNNCFHVETVHYGEYFSNINIEYYISLIDVYTLMGITDILNKGYVNSEDMKLALDYIKNNNENKKVIL